MCRSTAKRVFPAMYIEDLTELGFNDVTPDDPDFTSIQGQFTCGCSLDQISSDASLCSFLFVQILLYSLQVMETEAALCSVCPYVGSPYASFFPIH